VDIAIIQYNAGNTQSVIYALERLGIQPILTDNPELLQKADKVIFPGQGEASTAMDYLRAKGLDKVIQNLKQPFLGICIGMQLMCAHSEENDTPCLGIFKEKVKLFPAGKAKVPHMGWNQVKNLRSGLWKGIDEQSFVYFVHSYYVESNPHSLADCDYILPFCASIHRDNYYAVQFHPEKSAEVGAKILANFFEIS
jgi:imidazole glycerol-phosphate synthase subunit HisH